MCLANTHRIEGISYQIIFYIGQTELSRVAFYFIWQRITKFYIVIKLKTKLDGFRCVIVYRKSSLKPNDRSLFSSLTQNQCSNKKRFLLLNFKSQMKNSTTFTVEPSANKVRKERR